MYECETCSKRVDVATKGRLRLNGRWLCAACFDVEVPPYKPKPLKFTESMRATREGKDHE